MEDSSCREAKEGAGERKSPHVKEKGGRPNAQSPTAKSKQYQVKISLQQSFPPCVAKPLCVKNCVSHTAVCKLLAVCTWFSGAP